MTLMQESCLISLLFITHILEYPPECALGKVMPDRSPAPLLTYSFLVFPSFTLAVSCAALHQMTGALFYLGRNCQYGPLLNVLPQLKSTFLQLRRFFSLASYNDKYFFHLPFLHVSVSFGNSQPSLFLGQGGSDHHLQNKHLHLVCLDSGHIIKSQWHLLLTASLTFCSLKDLWGGLSVTAQIH